jgi:kremen protein
MRQVFVTVLASVGAITACIIPPNDPLSDNITQSFGIQVQNPLYPQIHNRFMNLWESGGGDQHLFLSPAGDAAFDLTLNQGWVERLPIRAVINGEVSSQL